MPSSITLNKYYELFNSNEQIKTNEIKQEDNYIECVGIKHNNINLNESDDEKIIDEIKALFNIKIMKSIMQIYPLSNQKLIANNHYIHINPARKDDYGIITNMTFIREGNCLVDRRELKRNLIVDFENNNA